MTVVGQCNVSFVGLEMNFVLISQLDPQTYMRSASPYLVLHRVHSLCSAAHDAQGKVKHNLAQAHCIQKNAATAQVPVLFLLQHSYDMLGACRLAMLCTVAAFWAVMCNKSGHEILAAHSQNH